jgi:NADH-quinone oxidoreductase subunit G
LEWPQVTAELKGNLTGTGRMGVVVSPNLTVEEAYMLCQITRQIDPDAVLALGPVPVIGEDEVFRNGFVIHAEKAPNRRGVEGVLRHFSGVVMSFDDFLAQLDSGEIKTAWVTAGYREQWIDDAVAARFSNVDMLVVQDTFDSPLWRAATYQLPSATFPERSGSFVNYKDRLQSFKWAIRPPAGVWVEGGLYWQLLGKRGLYNPGVVLEEMAAEITYFSAASDAIPPVGIDLKVNMLASAPVGNTA